ncbi:MAG: hypothetical protein KF745_05185 [Phycisphaeraceae bacterium]|nr:hypothetical protein [Phycisphaeraceae bacterium]
MTADPQSFKRAAHFSLLGMGLQIVLGIATLIYAALAADVAAMTAAIYILISSAVWLILAVVYDQHRRERLEAIEAESLAAEAARRSTVFEETGDDLRIASKRLSWMHRVLVPASSLILAAVLIGVGLWRFVAARGHVNPDNFIKPAPSLAYWAIAIGLVVGVTGFLYARFMSGMAKQPVWANLRAGATQAVGSALMGLAIAIGQFVLFAGSDGVLRYLLVVFPLMMVVLGAEIVLNFVLGAYRPRRPGELPRPAFDSRILGFIAAPDKIAESIGEALNYQFGFDVTGSWFYQLLSRSIAWLVVVGVGLVWIMTTLAVVNPSERALMLTNGKLVREVGPGPYAKLPWPFASVERFDATEARRIDLASPQAPADRPILWTNEHVPGEQDFYLLVQPPGSGERERNYALVAMEVPVLYSVDNLEKFENLGPTLEDRENLLKAIGQQVLLKYVATKRMDELLGPGLMAASSEIGRLIDKAYTKDRDCGITVLFCGIVGIHPPRDTATAFEQVVAAEQQRLANVIYAEGDIVKILSAAAGSVAAAKSAIDEIAAFDAMGGEMSAADASPERKAKILAIERLLTEGNGQAAVLIYEAKAERWTRHMAERGMAEAYSGELAAFTANPSLFKASRYFDSLKQMMANSRVYIVADDSPVEIRSDLTDLDSSGNPLAAPEANKTE